MIDLHCHLLPGVDDGAEDLDRALGLARMAVADGIKLSVLTPHVHLGRYDNDRSSITARVAAFQAALDNAGIALQVRGGGEVRIGPELMDMLATDAVPFMGLMGGDRVMLLEFPHSHIPAGSDRFVRWLVSQRVRPLIAHPERNKDVMAQPARIKPFVDMGCLLQLTAGSVLGHFGEAARAASERFLDDDMVFALATDAHDATRRPPILSQARDLLTQRGQDVLAQRLTRSNPARLLGLALEGV